MSPLPNSTAPIQFIDHGNANLVCTPSTVTSLLFFFLANYFAHCATVKSYPAETNAELAIAVVLALFFPSSGVIRALDSILRHSRLVRANEVQRAARAGALCMVVRTAEWEPQPGDVIRDIDWSEEAKMAANKINPYTYTTNDSSGDMEGLLAEHKVPGSETIELSV
jgi:hypothetical protein